MLNDREIIKVVLVEGGANDFAAYIGPSSWTDNEIASNGNKLSERAAREITGIGTPNTRKWDELDYRE